jgi:hypothetical protein
LYFSFLSYLLSEFISSLSYFSALRIVTVPLIFSQLPVGRLVLVAGRSDTHKFDGVTGNDLALDLSFSCFLIFLWHLLRFLRPTRIPSGRGDFKSSHLAASSYLPSEVMWQPTFLLQKGMLVLGYVGDLCLATHQVHMQVATGASVNITIPIHPAARQTM